MSLITAVEYDECRRWIKKRRNKGLSWASLLLAGKNSEDELEEFLSNAIDDYDWPSTINTVLWKQLVLAMEESEQKKIQLQNANRMAELHDGAQRVRRDFWKKGRGNQADSAYSGISARLFVVFNSKIFGFPKCSN